ncbi:hypothetical protein GWI33_009586, partial [Rhynchophorus ferrugineus]
MFVDVLACFSNAKWDGVRACCVTENNFVRESSAGSRSGEGTRDFAVEGARKVVVFT